MEVNSNFNSPFYSNKKLRTMNIKKYFAFLVLAITTLTAAAADVYISDFSIKAGETKLIAVNFDSERTDLKRLEGTITLPTGLTAINQGTTTNYLWMTADATRTNGALAQYNTGTGAAAVLAFGTPFNAGTGAIAYIKVSASTDLTDVSTITLSNFRATTTGNATVNLTSQNCTVTREAGTGTGDDPTPQTSDLAFSFSPATLTMTAGEVKQVEVQMANGMTATGMQADLVASTGLSIQSVTKSSRLSGWNYNPTLGRIVSVGAISGNEGTVFTVSLKADDDFSGAATLKLTNLATTDAGATSYQAEDVILPVTVQSQQNVALAFGSTQVNLNPGESTTVDVTLTSEVDLTGFMGTLTLPTGITATVGKGAIINSAPMYNTTTGMLAYLSGITAREGVLFTLTLTADDTFTAGGMLTLTNISTTTASALSIVPADINLPVHLKTTATVTAPTAKTGLVYNGEAQNLINAGSAEGGEIQYSLDGTTYATAIPTGLNAGTYTVYYKVVADESHNDVAPASLNVTIDKAALTIATLAQTSLTYSGSEQTVTVSSVKAGELDVPATDYDVTGNKQTAAGTYTVTVTAKAESNYAGSATAQFTITKAAATVTAPTAKTGLVYTAAAQQLVNKGSAEGATMLYSLDGTTYSEAVPTATNAGTYTVYYKATGDANHSDVAAASVEATIAKAALTTVTLAETSLTYNGSEQTVTVNSVKAGTLDVTAADYDVTGNKQTNVGDYTATVTVKAESNFTGTATAQWSITAEDAATFTLTIDPTSFVYDGTAKTPAVTVKDGSAVLIENIDYTLAYENNVNAGTAKVIATGKGNYSGTKEATFAIAKADATVTAPTAKTELVFNATAQTLIEAGSAEGGQMQYSTDGTNYSESVPAKTDAGTYTVYYKVTGDANHNDVAAASVNVTIAKAALTSVTLSQTSLVYNKTEQTVSAVSVKAGDLTVAAADYDVTGNKQTAAGTYTTTVTAKAESNFTGEATAQWTIAAADAATSFTLTLNPETFIYDGTEKKPAVTVKDGTTVLTKDVDYTVAYENNVNAGTATVIVTGMGNYSGTKTATFTITRTVFAIEAEDAENGTDVTGVTVDVTILDETAKTLRIDNLNVPAAAADEDLAIYIPATLGGYEVTEIADGAITETNVTDIYLPDTEQPLTIGTGALPGTATIHTTLALLDDYALMAGLKDNYEATKVLCTVTPVNKYWTLGTGCDVILPATLNAYTVTANSETQVSMIAISEADLTIGSERVLKGNNGVLLLGEAGQSYDLVAYSGRIASGTAIATTDNKDYGTSNLLEPVVEKMHYNADDSYFVMKNNEFHAIKAEGNEVKVPAGKAVLHLTSGQAGARAAVLGIVEGTTGIGSVGCDTVATDETIFDLSGRKVAQPVKGLYIINGKKVVVK